MKRGLERSRWCLLVATLAGLALVPTAPAATIHPNLTDDQVQITPAGCGRDAANTDHCTLREAIIAALPGDTVSLEPPAPAGPYVLDSEITVNKNITIRGNGARSTTISTAGCVSSTLTMCRVFHIDKATVTISRLTIADGKAKLGCGGTSFCLGLGGGILVTGTSSINQNGVLTLSDSTVRDNTSTGTGAGANGVGGGIEVVDGNLTVSGSTIAGNRADSVGIGRGIGGGIGATRSTVNVTNSTIAGNTVVDGSGGGLYSDDTPLTVRSTTISGNTAEGVGGGVRGGNIDAFNGTKYDIEGSIVANGIAPTNPNCLVANGPTNPASINSSGHNIDSLDECGFHAAGDQANTNPQLGPLIDNGGPTDTEAIGAASPAFDGGSSRLPADRHRPTRHRATPGCRLRHRRLRAAGIATPDKTASDVQGLRFERRAFAALGSGPSAIARKKKTPKGSRVSYTLAEDATVEFTVERATKGRRKGRKCVVKRRKGKRCTTYKQIKGSFVQTGKKGANGFKFTGRVGDRKLRPAGYRLVAIATDAAGNRGKAVRTGFRIKR